MVSRNWEGSDWSKRETFVVGWRLEKERKMEKMNNIPIYVTVPYVIVSYGAAAEKHPINSSLTDSIEFLQTIVSTSVAYVKRTICTRTA